MKEDIIDNTIQKFRSRSYLFEKNIDLNFYESTNIFKQFLNQFEKYEFTEVHTAYLPDNNAVLNSKSIIYDSNPNSSMQGVEVEFGSYSLSINFYPTIQDAELNQIPDFITDLINIHRRVNPCKTIKSIYEDEMTFLSNLNEQMYKMYIRIIKPIQLELLSQVQQLEDDERRAKENQDDDLSNHQTNIDISDYIDLNKVRRDLEELNQKNDSHKYITTRDGLLTFKKLSHLSAYLNENYPPIEYDYRFEVASQLASIFNLKVNYSSNDPFQLLRKPLEISPQTRKFFKL